MFRNWVFLFLALALILNLCACGQTGERNGGEESGTTFTLNEIYDVVRNGARLVLVYDPQSNSFNGTVENTTGNTLKQVRVEVHLLNGTELGPTIPVDLAPGEKIDVTLPATSQAFDGWTPHAEVGSRTDDGNDEHGGETGGEHGVGSG